MEERQGTGRRPVALDFGAYLRTGRLVAARGPVEVKFNPYHDPRNGQFTFAPGGGAAREIGHINRGWEGFPGSKPAKKPVVRPAKSRVRASGRVEVGGRIGVDGRAPGRWDSGPFPGGGGGSGGGGGASSTEVWPVTAPAPAPARARRSGGAAAVPAPPQSGRPVAGPAERPAPRPVRNARGVAEGNGQTGVVRRATNPAPIPPSAVVAAGAAGGASAASTVAAASTAVAAGATLASAGSAAALPAGWKIVNANGYDFKLNDFGRPEDMWGTVTRNNAQGRSRRHQAEAGGKDRLPTDEGGHFWARRFNGPKEAFNHFAQDMKFNRGAWRRMENEWDAADRAGKTVWVRITPRYHGRSMRPYEVKVEYRINGVPKRVTFPNGGG